MTLHFKLIFALLFISQVGVSQNSQDKAYLKGEYEKEEVLQPYTTNNQYVVDPISPIENIDAEIKNVILLIGDGMGVSHVFAALSANNDRLYIEYADKIGFQKTKSKNKYKPDSAAAGTALACGIKTNNGVIGMDTQNRAVKSILEIASENNKSTGLIASAKITHATPASFIAHVPSRGQYEDIATFFISDKVDVFIGGGMDDFDKREDSRSLLPDLFENGFQIVTTIEEMDQVQQGKMAALLSSGHVDRYPLRADFLPQSTKKAIQLLSQNENGFFLMVEGSQIDWGGHDNDVGYVIEEMLDFDRTIGEVLKFAQQDGHTLVIITADHETGGMSIHDANPEKGTIEARFTTGSHTSVMVPVFAYGPGAEQFTGIYENTDIFYKMLKAFNFTEGIQPITEQPKTSSQKQAPSKQ